MSLNTNLKSKSNAIQSQLSPTEQIRKVASTLSMPNGFHSKLKHTKKTKTDKVTYTTSSIRKRTYALDVNKTTDSSNSIITGNNSVSSILVITGSNSCLTNISTITNNNLTNTTISVTNNFTSINTGTITITITITIGTSITAIADNTITSSNIIISTGTGTINIISITGSIISSIVITVNSTDNISTVKNKKNSGILFILKNSFHSKKQLSMFVFCILFKSINSIVSFLLFVCHNTNKCSDKNRIGKNEMNSIKFKPVEFNSRNKRVKKINKLKKTKIILLEGSLPVSIQELEPVYLKKQFCLGIKNNLISNFQSYGFLIRNLKSLKTTGSCEAPLMSVTNLTSLFFLNKLMKDILEVTYTCVVNVVSGLSFIRLAKINQTLVNGELV